MVPDARSCVRRCSSRRALPTLAPFALAFALALTAPLPGATAASAGTATIALAGLAPGTRLALLGDSITEHMLYTVDVEAYLLACAGRLDLSVFQFGWGGETAATVPNRITRGDLDAFTPNAAAIAYGANDGGGMAWAAWMEGMWTGRISGALNALDSRYPGIAAATVICSPTLFELKAEGGDAARLETVNDTLGRFRDLDLMVARSRGCGFADWRGRMAVSGAAARAANGGSYRFGGSDGVHAGPNGHLMLAHELLKALGQGGDIATITVALAGAPTAALSPGHRLLAVEHGTITIASSRWPFCAAAEASAAADRPDTILPFLPFADELNRFMLVVTGLEAQSATVTWGTETHSFTRAELAAGVNLAGAFLHTPFDAAFARLLVLIRAQQAKEQAMIKSAREATAPAHGWSPNDVAARDALDAAVHAAVVPFTHTIAIQANRDGAAAPVINHGELRGLRGRPLEYRISAANQPLRFTASGLPTGLTLDAQSGVISGTPGLLVDGGTVHVTASNQAGTGTGTLGCTITEPPPLALVISALAASGTVGQPFRYQIATSIAAGKYYATGLPDGLNVSAADGAITGTPRAPGSSAVLISGENAGGNGPAATLVLTIAAAPAGVRP